MSQAHPGTGYPKTLWGRAALIVLVGPIFGGLAMFAIMFVVFGVLNGFPGISQSVELLGLYLIFGWLAGLLPALVSAIVWLAVEHRVTEPVRRCLLAVAIGGVSGAALIWPTVVFFAGPYAPGPLFSLPAAMAGAVALVLGAGAWHPTPKASL